MPKRLERSPSSPPRALRAASTPEAARAKTSLARGGDTAAAVAAKTNASDFTPKKKHVARGPSIDPNEPALMKDAVKDHVTWKTVPDGHLFIDGVSHDAITQGDAGDCYFLSAVSSLAWTKPSAIHDLVTDNHDGTFTVHFHQKGKGGTDSVANVTVDGKLPFGKGGAEYATDRDPKEMWPGIVEKAYAQWKGGYENIGEGGDAGEAMYELTGKKSDYLEHVAKTDPETLFDEINKATAEGRCVVSGTFDKKHQPVSYDTVGLVEGHDYTVLDAFKKDGQEYVKLRNPWGETGWKHDEAPHDTDDGTFTMKYADFRKMFDDLSIMTEKP